MLTQDPLAVVEGRPYGRGLIIGVAAGLGCALILLGIDMAESLGSARHSVVPFLVALPLALLPVPLLIALVLLLDRLEPEPPGNLVFCFAWGAGIAALLAGILNTAGLLYVTQPALGRGDGQFVSAAIGAPVVEESLKGLVLVWLLWRRRQELDGPTDGIIYAAMVGIGFAMMENVGYYISALATPVTGGVPLLEATFVFRGVIAPLAHPVFTAMTGIGAAYAATHRRGGWALALGLFGAMVLHGLWNGLTSLGLSGIILAYGLLACVLVALITVVVADRRRMVGDIRRYLPRYQAAGLVSEADLRMLCTLRERRQARRWARRTGGRPLARAMVAYQLAATELALAHQRVERGAATPAEFEERKRALTGVMASALLARGGDPPEPPGGLRPGSFVTGPGPCQPGGATPGGRLAYWPPSYGSGDLGWPCCCQRAGAGSAAAGACGWPVAAARVPRSRSANISRSATIQIRVEPQTCTQTRPAGRPLKYWMYPIMPCRPIIPSRTQPRRTAGAGARVSRRPTASGTARPPSSQPISAWNWVAPVSGRWNRGTAPAPASGPVPVTTVPAASIRATAATTP
jgi:RsiW-degrading membrane proteinase PrsW (M82 family)